MYLRDVIPFQHRTDLVMPDWNCQCIFIEVDKNIFAKSKNVIIGVIYRHPGTDLNLFNTIMENINSAQEWWHMLLRNGRL